MRRTARGAITALAAVAAGGLVLAGCTGAPSATPSPTSTVATSATPTPSATPVDTGTATPTPAPDDLGALVPSGDPVPVAGGLATPWSIAVLGDGSMLVSLRDSGQIVEIAGGQVVPVATVPGVVHAGEGGLLGLAALEDASGSYLYAYLTTASDNRVVRMPLGGSAGAHTLGAVEEVMTGLPKGSNHNGGRIAFGPDRMLYVTVGDAGTPSDAQTLDSLGGKILRVSPVGAVPADNPFPGSPVWSMGHRNPQGLDWAADGTMWAAEFGQDTWDEVNVISPGANYGWPVVEGIGSDPGFVNPVVQWNPDDASPSGLAVIGDTVFVAGLGGERLWTVGFDGAAAEWYGGGQLGRIRDVVRGPGSTLYLVTSNTDQNGSPRDGDDMLYQVNLVPAG